MGGSELTRTRFSFISKKKQIREPKKTKTEVGLRRIPFQKEKPPPQVVGLKPLVTGWGVITPPTGPGTGGGYPFPYKRGGLKSG